MPVVGFSFVASVKGSMDLQIEKLGKREETGKLIVSLAATIKLFWLCLSANCATKVLRLPRKQLTTMAGSGSKLQQEAACNREPCSIINKALSRAHNFIRCPFARFPVHSLQYYGARSGQMESFTKANVK